MTSEFLRSFMHALQTRIEVFMERYACSYLLIALTKSPSFSAFAASNAVWTEAHVSGKRWAAHESAMSQVRRPHSVGTTHAPAA